MAAWFLLFARRGVTGSGGACAGAAGGSEAGSCTVFVSAAGDSAFFTATGPAGNNFCHNLCCVHPAGGGAHDPETGTHNAPAQIVKAEAHAHSNRFLRDRAARFRSSNFTSDAAASGRHPAGAASEDRRLSTQRLSFISRSPIALLILLPERCLRAADQRA